MRFLFLCLFLFMCRGLWSQHVQLTREQALADIDTLVNRITYTHPDPFTICPETVFRERIIQVKKGLPDSLTDLEFGRRVIPCVAMLGDGHTVTLLPRPVSEHPLLPLGVRVGWRDSSLTLADSGEEILSINGVPVKEVLENMLRYVSGERMHFRFMCVQLNFNLFLDALYPDSVYRLVLQKTDGTQAEQVVKTLPYGEIKSKVQEAKARTGKKKADYAFQVSQDGKSMLFEFNRFYDWEKFKVFADSMFREIKKQRIKNLVIDIRKNGGGDSRLGDELLQYLLHKPFSQFGKVQARVGRYTKDWAGKDSIKLKGVDSLFTTILPLTSLRKEPLRLSKKTKVYLLISNNTFSSASAFSWAFQYFKGGTVVGEESGGMNVTFGDIRYYTLPHSRLLCGISWKRFYQYGADEGCIHGTLPDVEIPAEQAFEYTVKQLIRKGKK